MADARSTDTGDEDKLRPCYFLSHYRVNYIRSWLVDEKTRSSFSESEPGSTEKYPSPSVHEIDRYSGCLEIQ